MHFELRSISSIMDEADYNGLRIMMDAYLERTLKKPQTGITANLRFLSLRFVLYLYLQKRLK